LATYTDRADARPVPAITGAWSVAPNLVAQDFAADGLDRERGANISYIWTVEGCHYLAVILDLFSRLRSRPLSFSVADVANNASHGMKYSSGLRHIIANQRLRVEKVGGQAHLLRQPSQTSPALAALTTGGRAIRFGRTRN